MTSLTHFDDDGASRMVDVSAKPVSDRMAKAEATVFMRPETLRIIRQKEISKGDVLEVARLAGIMATKRTDELIPLCHSLGLDSASIEFSFLDEKSLHIQSTVSVAALTVYDMCKAIDRAIEISHVRLVEKSGGNSGHFIRDN